MTDEPSKEALAEARELRSAWLKQAPDPDNGLGLTEVIALALDKARAEEREECAKVALAGKYILGTAKEFVRGYNRACREAAAAIRNRANRT